MIPEFDYFRPKNLQEALDALSNSKTNARLIAGGTDIIPGFHINSKRFRNIRLLVDIFGLPELTAIEQHNDGLHIGGAATFATIGKNHVIQKQYPLLAQAVSQIGSVQIRNRATIAGNFVNNAPCADSVPPLLVYDAQLLIQSLNKERRLPLSDFLLKPYRTQLNADELVKAIILPEAPKDYCGDFYKLGRRRGVAISRITLAVLLKLDNGIIQDIHIASGAVTPIGKRFPGLEKMAMGQKAEVNFLKELSVSLGEQILEATGLRWSTAYKLPVVQQAFYGMLRRIAG